MIGVSWQARLHLNKRVKFYSLCLGNFELGRRYVNIGFLTPAKLRSGNYSFKYSLLRPGEAQKWGLFIQIFAFSPRHSSNAGAIHPNTRFYAPVQPKTLELYKQTYLNPHKTNHAQRNPTKHCRITLRVILFLSNELSIQKSEHRQSIGIHLYYCANF